MTERRIHSLLPAINVPGSSADPHRRGSLVTAVAHALGMGEPKICDSSRSPQILTISVDFARKPPYDSIQSDAVAILEANRGRKPDRPPSGFSDGLGDLLSELLDPEHGSQPLRRPSVQSFSNQMREDRSTVTPQQLQEEVEESLGYLAYLETR